MVDIHSLQIYFNDIKQVDYRIYHTVIYFKDGSNITITRECAIYFKRRYEEWLECSNAQSVK